MCATELIPLTTENLAQWNVTQTTQEDLKKKTKNNGDGKQPTIVSKSSMSESSRDTKIFPQHLMEALNDPVNHDAINWLPHGKAFTVLNRDKLCHDVLPKICGHKTKKYSSFTRKLSQWNFHHVTMGPEAGSYYHEYFE